MNINKDITIILILLLLTCIFFWKAIIYPNEIIYSNQSDIFINIGLINNIKDGINLNNELPIWNPFILSGFPLVGHSAYSIFYPTIVLFSFLPIETILNCIFILHIFLGGIFMYFFMKKINMDTFSSFISSILVIFNGLFIQHIVVGHIQVIYLIPWIILTFLLFEISIEKNSLFYGLLTGVPLALQILAGHVQYFLYTLLSLFFYFIFKIYPLLKEKKYKKITRSFIILIIAILTCISLSAIQLLPSLEFSEYSNRAGGVDYWFSTRISLPPWHLITPLIPEFFGTPLDNSYLSTSNFWNLCIYVGILPLILGVIGIFLKENKYKTFFLLLSIFSLLFALGNYTPVFTFFYNFIPFFNLFRAPSRFLLFYIISLSVLSGIGCNFLIKKIDKKNKKKLWKLIKIFISLFIISTLLLIIVFFGKNYIMNVGESLTKTTYQNYLDIGITPGPIDYYLEKIPLVYQHIVDGFYIFLFFFVSSILLLILKIKKMINTKYLKILLIIIIVADLFLFGMKYIDIQDPEVLFKKPYELISIENDNSRYRILALNDIIPQWMVSKYEIELTESGTGIQLEHHKQFLDIVGNRPFDIRDPTPLTQIKHPKLLDLLNTKYIISKEELDDERYELVEDGEVNVYLNKKYLPRAFVVRNAKVIKNKEDIFDELRSDDFEPKEYIIIEEDQGVPLENKGDYKEAEIIFFSPNKINIKIELNEPGYLVLSEVWYPGWNAYENEEKIEVYKTNYVLRSIYLEEGEHSIEFRFELESFKIGSWISITTLLILIILIFYKLFKRDKI